MKNPLYTLTIFCFSLFLFSSVQAQRPHQKGEQWERIQSHKIAFITDRLKLSPKEATMFWPVYNEYSLKRQEIQKEIRNIIKEIRNPQNSLSNKELETLGDNLIEKKISEADLAKFYHKKFKTVLAPEKVIRLYVAEEQFKNHLLKMVRSQKPHSPRKTNRKQ